MNIYDVLLFRNGKSLKEVSFECYWNEIGWLVLDSLKKYGADDYRIYQGCNEIK